MMKQLLRTLLLTLALVVTGAALAPPVFAQTAAEKKKAGEHFGRGLELYNEGNFAGALVEFDRAYELAPNYRVLFNIGQVKYQLQDYPGAMAAFQQYLKDGGAQIPADRREIVLKDIERLRSRVAYVKIEVNEAGATVSVDDRPVGTSPIPKAVAVSAGRRKITASSDGAAPVTKFLDLAGGDEASVRLDIVRQDVPIPPPPPPPGGGTGPDEEGGNVPWAAWGVTAAFGVGALAFGLLALNAASELDDAKAAETTKDELDDNRQKVLGFSIATDVLLAATVVTAAISVYLTVDANTGDDDEEPGGEVGIRIAPTGIAVQGSF